MFTMMTQKKDRMNLILTVLGAAMLLQTVSAVTFSKKSVGGWFQLTKQITYKETRDVEIDIVNGTQTRFETDWLFYVINVLPVKDSEIKMDIIFKQRTRTDTIPPHATKLLADNCKEVLTSDTMKKVLDKAEIHSTVSEKLSKDVDISKLVNVMDNFEACSKVAEKLLKGVDISKLGEAMDNFEACKSLKKFFDEKNVKPGDWVVATTKSGIRSSSKFAKNDVGQIAGINFKDNGKFQWKVKWYHTKKETDKRCNNKETRVNVSAQFEKLQGIELELMNKAQQIVDQQNKRIKLDLYPIRGFIQENVETFTGKNASDQQKNVLAAAKRFLSQNGIKLEEDRRRRRLHSMERLLRDIKRAQRTA